MANRVRIDGLAKLERKLLALSDSKTFKKEQRRGLVKATNVVKNAAKAKVPVDEGDLKKSLTTKVSVRATGGYGIVGANDAYVRVDEDGNVKKPSNYDHLVEYGTVDTPAHPFLEPAAEQSQGSAVSAIEQVLTEAIDKVT